MNELIEVIKQVFDVHGSVCGASGSAVHESHEFSKFLRSKKKVTFRVLLLFPIGVFAGLIIGAVLGGELDSKVKCLYMFLCGITWKPFASNSKQFLKIVLKVVLDITDDNNKKGDE